MRQGGYNHDYDFVTVVTRDIDARLEQWKSRQLAWELTAQDVKIKAKTVSFKATPFGCTTTQFFLLLQS